MTSSHRLQTSTTLAFSLLTLALCSHSVYGGGFGLDGPGSAAMGNSYAGQVTGAHDLSDSYINPAVLTEFSKDAVVSSNMLLDYTIKIDPGATAQTATSKNIDLLGNGSSGTDGGNTAFIPALYTAHALSEKTSVGFGISAPWGIKSTYPDQWIGRYQAINSEIRSLDLTPVVAYQVSTALSIAGGINLQYLEANMSNAIDFGSLTTGDPSFSADGKAEVSGNSWAPGYQAGLLYKPNESTRLGIAYRSKVHHDIKGDTDFTVPTALVAAVTAGGAFVDTDVSFDITTPEQFNLGWQQKLSPQLEWVAEADYTRWSRVKSLVIDSGNPNQPDDTTVFNWQNNWRYTLGLNYFYNNQLTLRSGLGYEETAITEKYFSPRVPIANKYFLSFGSRYQISHRLTLDIAYLHEFFEKGHTNLNIANGSSNLYRGNLTVDNQINLNALAAHLQFAL